MMTWPMFPRGPGVRSIATLSRLPGLPKTIQPGEPTSVCTAALGEGAAASIAAYTHGSRRVVGVAMYKWSGG